LIHGIQLSQLSSEIVPSARTSQGFSGQTVGAEDIFELGLEVSDKVGLGVARAITGVAVGLLVGTKVGLSVRVWV
jgi:hypothetical protein